MLGAGVPSCVLEVAAPFMPWPSPLSFAMQHAGPYVEDVVPSSRVATAERKEGEDSPEICKASVQYTGKGPRETKHTFKTPVVPPSCTELPNRSGSEARLLFRLDVVNSCALPTVQACLSGSSAISLSW
jgi:hypothetical protein